jgi:hypothetical protein
MLFEKERSVWELIILISKKMAPRRRTVKSKRLSFLIVLIVKTNRNIRSITQYVLEANKYIAVILTKIDKILLVLFLNRSRPNLYEKRLITRLMTQAGEPLPKISRAFVYGDENAVKPTLKIVMRIKYKLIIVPIIKMKEKNCFTERNLGNWKPIKTSKSGIDK